MSDNLEFPGVFWGYRNGTLSKNGSKVNVALIQTDLQCFCTIMGFT